MKSKSRSGRYARLRDPLLRKNDQLCPVSWEEALETVATGVKATTSQLGPSGFGFFSCSKTTNELNFIAQKFVRSVIGSNNIDSCNRT